MHIQSLTCYLYVLGQWWELFWFILNQQTHQNSLKGLYLDAATSKMAYNEYKIQ